MTKTYSRKLLQTTGTLTIEFSDNPTVTTESIHYLVSYTDGVMLIGDPLEETESFVALSLPPNREVTYNFDETYPTPASGKYPLRWQVSHKGKLRTAKSGTIKGTTRDIYREVNGSFTMTFDDNTTAEGTFAIKREF